MYRKTYIEVNIDNLQSNIKNLINKFNNYEYHFGVVKGNAYGHGSKAAKYVAEAGVNYLAVASLEEGINIRNEVPKMPILCLEPIDIEYLNKCIEYNITITIHSYEYFKNLKDVKLKKGLKVHLKIDSGFNRLGRDDKNQVKEIADYLHENKNIIFEGIFSHFATSGVADKEWDNQVESFLEITSLINLDAILIRHFAKSNALVNHPKLTFCNGC